MKVKLTKQDGRSGLRRVGTAAKKRKKNGPTSK